MRAGLVVGMLATTAHQARADEPAVPPPEPIIAAEDTRSHASVLLERYQLAATYSHLFAGDGAGLVTAQLALGPMRFDEPHLRELLGWAEVVGLRVRATALDAAQDDRRFGPLTIALQRYFPVEPLAIAPLVHAHLGLEAAIATPWLSDPGLVPAGPLQTAAAVDSELSSNGWSLRPVSVYARFDLLVCRSFYFELGAEPEVFVPTIAGRSTAYGVRYHLAAGAALGCVRERDSWRKNLAVAVEYRGRGRLYEPNQPPDFHDVLAVELQHRGKLSYGAYVTSNFHSFIGIGGRIQLGGR